MASVRTQGVRLFPALAESTGNRGGGRRGIGARMANYKERLKDRRWQRKRLRIFNRDKWTCTRCGCTRNDVQLHVHHVKYSWSDFYRRIPADPWDCPDSDLVSLCEPCHSKNHGRKPKRHRPSDAFRMPLKSDPRTESLRRKFLEQLGEVERG